MAKWAARHGTALARPGTARLGHDPFSTIINRAVPARQARPAHSARAGPGTTTEKHKPTENHRKITETHPFTDSQINTQLNILKYLILSCLVQWLPH
jgi:hypothetical protein